MLAAHTAAGVWHVLRSTGEVLLAPISTGIATLSMNSYVVTDLNGDQRSDLAYRNTAGTWLYRTRPSTFAHADLLATATDGFGVAATFAYAPLTSATVYTKGSGAVFPDLDYQGPLWVVSSLTSTDGTRQQLDVFVDIHVRDRAPAPARARLPRVRKAHGGRRSSVLQPEDDRDL